MTRQIIAIGGHGMNVLRSENLKLHQYILQVSPQKNPKIAFLGTATGDDKTYTASFYDGFARLSCRPSHLNLFFMNQLDYQDYLLNQDIIYVGGGNTFNMLKIWQGWGVDKLLKTCYEKGIILAGSSAGSICWFIGGNSDSFSQLELHPVEGLGFLPFSHSPHYDGEKLRKPNYHKLIKTGELPAGYAMDNYAGIHFVDEKPKLNFASKQGAKVYFVGKKEGEVVETELQVEGL